MLSHTLTRFRTLPALQLLAVLGLLALCGWTLAQSKKAGPDAAPACGEAGDLSRLTPQQRMSLLKLEAREAELARCQAEQGELRRRLLLLQAAGRPTRPAETLEERVALDEKLLDLRVVVAELKEDIERGKQRFSEGARNPIIKRLQEQLVAAEKQLADRLEKLRKEVQDQGATGFADVREELRLLEEYEQEIKKEIQSILAKVPRSQAAKKK